jgi:hypothetical protein
MKYIFTSSTIAIVAVVMLLTTGTEVTNFITPAYAPEPARLASQLCQDGQMYPEEPTGMQER